MSVDETNIASILVANVDQLIADDFKPSGQFGGPREFVIVSVAVKEKKAKTQSMDIMLEGEKFPYRPCLTMQRYIAEKWGTNVRTWKGRTLRLYRETENVNSPDGEKNVGGVRINGLSHIAESCIITLREARGRNRKWPCEKLETKQAPTLATALGDVTIDDLDRYRATESRPAVATLTDDERTKMAAYYAANPRALDKCRAWVAANPKPTETL
jgi:hypothetical protein